MRTLLAVFFLQCAASVFALTPLPPPHSHNIHSANKRYYAAVSARTKVTKVKEVRRGWPDRTLWTIPHYLEWASVADDGAFVMTCSWLVIPPFSKEQEVIWVYHPGGKRTSITVGSLVKDLTRLEPVMEMGRWGSVEGIEGEWLRVTTCEKRDLYVHANSGEVRATRPTPPKELARAPR